MDVTGPVSGRELLYIALYVIIAFTLLGLVARKLGH